jgi:hypothetical protein
MRRFRIVVTQTVADDRLDHDDRETNPAGRYLYAAVSEDAALDAFHRQVPIACLDDFEVAIEPFVEKAIA